MDFLDEEVMEFRKKRKKDKYSTLETGMYIKDEIVSFQEVKILDEKVALMLPDTFVDMPSAIAKIKYPSELRPQVIKTSLDTTINFTASLYEVPCEAKHVKSVVHQFKDLIQKVNPSYVFYECMFEDEPAAGWFDFKSYGIDEPLYNIMYVTPIEGKILHVIFNCRYRDMLEWKEAAVKVFKSINHCGKR